MMAIERNSMRKFWWRESDERVGKGMRKVKRRREGG